VILATTSRRPSEKIRTLCNDLVYSIPHLIRISRGKKSLFELAEIGVRYGADRVIVLNRWKNHMGRMEFYRIKSSGLVMVHSSLGILNFRPRRDFKHRFGSIKSLAITNSSSDPDVEYISEMISEYLEVRISSNRDAKLYDASMDFSSEISSDCRSISARFFLQPSGQEIGPYLSMKRN
jgi:rRNA maturation protein Rpf1